jgi:CRP/FNR family cyclic AMP-dependent transcriptional regulator
MLSLTEPAGGFAGLVRQYKQLTQELIGKLDITGETVQLHPTEDALHNGLDHEHSYLVKGGMLGVKCHDRRLFLWDEGDLVLPDAGGQDLTYYAENKVLLTSYNTLELVRTLLAHEDTARLWTRLLTLQQAMLVRILAAHVDEDTQTTPGFAYYQAGEIIIQQGDRADYVFSLFEGSADVVVDGVTVGEVSEGEVLGAMALLTESPRSATIKAKARCSVVKVPRDQFKSLIRTNPTMIHGLLTDMAKQIKSLNQQVVELSNQG